MGSDSSESEDSEDSQNDRIRQFNDGETKEVITNVLVVLKLIVKALKKNTKGTKELKKTIRKEPKNTKLKKTEATNVNTLIRNLCNAIKAIIASPPACPESDLPTTSRHNEAVPGNSRSYNEAAPGTSRHSTEEVVTETSKNLTKPTKETSKYRTEPTVPSHSSSASRTANPETDGSYTTADHDVQISNTNRASGDSGIPESHDETHSGSFRSQSITNVPESSRRHAENEVLETSSLSDVTKSVASKPTNIVQLPSSSSKSIPENSNGLTKTAPETSRNTTKDILNETYKNVTRPTEESCKNNTEITETSRSPGSSLNVDSGISELCVETDTGPSRSSSETNFPESLTRPPKTVSETSSRSDVAPLHIRSLDPEIPSGSTKSVSENSKSLTETTSRHDAGNVLTGTDSFKKSAEETSRSNTESQKRTTESRTEAASRISQIRIEASPGHSKSNSETKILESSRKNAEIMVSGSPTSRKIAAGSEILKDTTRVVSGTCGSSTAAMPGTTKTDSHAVEHPSSSSKILETSSVTSGNNNSQMCTETIIVTSEMDEINNNITASKINNTEKRIHINSNNDNPKRARIDDKCTLCGKIISNRDFSTHYKNEHGIHHEIKHNYKNYEHKIKDLDKRLHDPMDKNKTDNNRTEKITVDSKKRTAARSFSAPNEVGEQNVANQIADSEEVEEPVDKKRRTAARSVSASHESDKLAGVATVKEETNQNTVSDVFVVDLTDDNDFVESKPPTDAKDAESKPNLVEGDQVLNDHTFIDLCDDTSLYEAPGENEIQFAESLLSEHVKKEKAANDQLDNDIEVVSMFSPSLLDDQKPSGCHKKTEQGTEQMLIQRDSLESRNVNRISVSDSCMGGIVPESSFSTSSTQIKESKTFGNTSQRKQGTARKPSEAKEANASNNFTNEGSGTTGNRTKDSLKTFRNIIETIEPLAGRSKGVSAVSPNANLKRPKQKSEKRCSRKKYDTTRKSSNENSEKILSNPDKVSFGPTVTDTSVNVPKLSTSNGTNTTQLTQITNQSNFANIDNLNTNNASTRTTYSRSNPVVSVSISNSTTEVTTNQTQKTKQRNTNNQTTNANNNVNRSKSDLGYPQLASTANASKNTVPNSSVSVSVPNCTTITPVQVTQRTNQTSGKHNNTASTGVSQLNNNLGPTPISQVNRNITSNLVQSALKKQSLPQTFGNCFVNPKPHFYANVPLYKPNPATPNASKSSISVLSQNGGIITTPREHLPNPCNTANVQTNKTSVPVLKSNHRQPVPPVLKLSRNTAKVPTSNIKSTSSPSRPSEPKRSSNTTQNKSVTENTSRPQQGPSFSQPNRRQSDTNGDIQSPQIQWYPPLLFGAAVQALNIINPKAPGNSLKNKRSSTSFNTHPKTHNWHTPESQNERSQTNRNVAESVTPTHLSSSNAVPLSSTPLRPMNQRVNNQRVNATESSSNPDSGRPSLLIPRQQSTLLSHQRTRLPQTGISWHTPVNEPPK